MNLFLVLSQLGLTRETLGEPLLPVGTVYDPFVCRGLDAFIYALYVGARFVIAGTPSGVTLSREGGAHQSTVTPSLGLELPGVTYAEPAYPAEVDWLLRDALRRIADDDDAESLYLRLSTKPVDPAPFEALRAQRGEDALRRDVLAGGFRFAAGSESPGYRGGDPVVTLAGCGAMVPEMLAAARLLADDEGIHAGVVALTSPDRAYRGWRRSRLAPISGGAAAGEPSHLERLLAADGDAPIVSVIDGASHSLAFLGGVSGRRQVTLGVDAFGQSGSLADVYDHYELSPDAIAAAAVAALL
jgi:pyruvate dehydrogenase E1 component